MKKTTGFALIELLIILAITGILCATGFWSLKMITSQYQLRSAARELLISMKKAKVMAIHGYRPVIIQLAANTYTWCRDENSNDVCETEESPHSVTLHKNVQLQKITFRDGKTGYTQSGRVWHNRFGSVEIVHLYDAGTYKLTMASRGTLRLTENTDDYL